MAEPFDLTRLKSALDEAIAAVPHLACEREDEAFRRECREIVLLLRQTRERVRTFELRHWPSQDR